MPTAVLALLITGLGELMVMSNEAVPDPLPLAALKLTLAVPVTVGIPEILPLLVLTLNPAGSPVAPNDVGELVAVIV